MSLDRWEKALSLISETVEMLMGVQRKWMYLESIFVGSEDIRKQLPTESDSFDRVNDAWNTCTNDLKEAVTAYKGTHLDGMLDNLNNMDEQLDAIQKSLDEYLETKRQAFPRFYFLSNDDLLEILGQARDPMAVQVNAILAQFCAILAQFCAIMLTPSFLRCSRTCASASRRSSRSR